MLLIYNVIIYTPGRNTKSNTGPNNDIRVSKIYLVKTYDRLHAVLCYNISKVINQCIVREVKQ